MALVHRARSVALLSLVVVAACADGATTPTAPTGAGPARSVQRAGAGIPTRAQERPGTFADMPDRDLWSHIAFSDGRAVVGLRAPGAARGVWRGEVLVDRPVASQARQAVARHAGVTLVAADDVLPVVDVAIASFEAFQKLRRLPMVDYIEPRARAATSRSGARWAGAAGRARGTGRSSRRPNAATATRSASTRCRSPPRGTSSPATGAPAGRG
jgi:hypothetical protein